MNYSIRLNLSAILTNENNCINLIHQYLKGSSGVIKRQNSIDKQRSFSTSSSLLKPVFCSTADEAVKDIPSGSKLLVGGKD